MDSAASAALSSWSFDWGVISVLLISALVYLRGWMRGRRILRQTDDVARLGCFLGGLSALFLAAESPLDALDGMFLSAHMTQHLLLMMVAPPLLLLGHPMLPFLRGLPRGFVKEGLGPFLAWPWLQGLLRWLVAPPTAWFIFAVSTIAWHLPKMYTLALNHPEWHAVQHACFFWTGIVFWWNIYPAKGHRARQRWPRWTAIPYLLLADIVNTALSAFFIFSDRVLYSTYSALNASAASALHDQQLAGAIMWVPGSLVYLFPAVGIAMRLLSGGKAQSVSFGRDKLIQIATPVGSTRIRSMPYRRATQVTMLLVAIAVMADGFWGTQVGPLNLAGVLPWIHWRAFSVVALLVFGNLFCMSCPFVLARDAARRVLPVPARFRWPRVLRNKWIPAALFLLYLWAYEAFSLWDSPRLTACVTASYFVAAIAVDSLFRGASFCKYCCPIGQFHFITSLVSPREVKVRKIQTCKSCETFDCIRGNSRARGCELHLFQPKKVGNLDCTFCLDCVKACPHDNVGIFSVAPGSTLLSDPYRSSIGRLSKRLDFTVLAVLVVFGAILNAAGMVSPVMTVEHRLHALLGSGAMPAIVASFLFMGVVVVPMFFIACGWLTMKLFGASHEWQRFVLALVPVGVSMWAAHLIYHLAIGWSQPLPILAKFFGGSINAAAVVIPLWVTPIQLVLLDGGVLLTMYVIWKLASSISSRATARLGISAPWVTIACGLYICGAWILFQPMQMRGMTH